MYTDKLHVQLTQSEQEEDIYWGIDVNLSQDGGKRCFKLVCDALLPTCSSASVSCNIFEHYLREDGSFDESRPSVVNKKVYAKPCYIDANKPRPEWFVNKQGVRSFINFQYYEGEYICGIYLTDLRLQDETSVRIVTTQVEMESVIKTLALEGFVLEDMEGRKIEL